MHLRFESLLNAFLVAFLWFHCTPHGRVILQFFITCSSFQIYVCYIEPEVSSIGQHMYWCDMADEGISKRNQVSLPHSLRKSSNRSLLSSFHLPTNLFLISSIICKTPNLVSLMLLRLAVRVIKKKFNKNAFY